MLADRTRFFILLGGRRSSATIFDPDGEVRVKRVEFFQPHTLGNCLSDKACSVTASALPVAASGLSALEPWAGGLALRIPAAARSVVFARREAADLAPAWLSKLGS